MNRHLHSQLSSSPVDANVRHVRHQHELSTERLRLKLAFQFWVKA